MWIFMYVTLNYYICSLITFKSVLIILTVLSEEMYFEGYKNITNVDYSNNLIKHLIERYSDGFES